MNVLDFSFDIRFEEQTYKGETFLSGSIELYFLTKEEGWVYGKLIVAPPDANQHNIWEALSRTLFETLRHGTIKGAEGDQLAFSAVATQPQPPLPSRASVEFRPKGERKPILEEELQKTILRLLRSKRYEGVSMVVLHNLEVSCKQGLDMDFTTTSRPRRFVVTDNIFKNVTPRNYENWKEKSP